MKVRQERLLTAAAGTIMIILSLSLHEWLVKARLSEGCKIESNLPEWAVGASLLAAVAAGIYAGCWTKDALRDMFRD